MFARIAAILALAGCAASSPASITDAAGPATDDAAMKAWAAACEASDEWDKPGPPFRIYGETYYVGTCGITAILAASPQGHTLIDSGTEKGAEIVLANIRALGFDPADVKTLLISHEHLDHVGGMARLQAATGAPLKVLTPARETMLTGRADPADPQAGLHPAFPGVARVEVLHEGELMSGGRAFRVLATPGHTLGAQSLAWRECAGGECRSIVYLDSLNPISRDGYRFADHPELVAAMRDGLAKAEALDCDLLLAPHPSAAEMRDRLLGVKAWVDGEGCKAYVARARQRLDARLAQEAGGG